MMLSPPSTMVRSSLEEMLDSLQRQDENQKPKDMPPALPARPTSRARLPTAKKSLPSGFKIGDADEVPPTRKVPLFSAQKSLPNSFKIRNHDDNVTPEKEDRKRKDKKLLYRNWSFGNKRMKREPSVESPYELSAVDHDSAPQLSLSPKDLGSRREDNIGYFINKKLGIWCQLPTGQWLSGRIQSSSGDEAVVSLSNGNVVEVSTADLLPANPDILEGVDDLTHLSYLNEPSVLHNLRFRYFQDKIYNKAGPLLIAVNPYKNIQLYGGDFVSMYRQNLTDSPHVFSIASAAYNQMMRDEQNQSIIISGESGAGKTETAKFAMQFLATLGNGNGMEHRILHSNFVLEAFGNAKTSRNNNSSRFGKLIEIHFNASGKIWGAKIKTFLVEKSRVVQLANDERSYHIFYQLCAGAPSVLREKLNLKMASEYCYLNQSDCLVIDGIDDACRFNALTEAMEIVQIGKEDQENVFQVLASILWLGNISFEVVDSENHVEVRANEALRTSARMIGCSPHDLMLALSTHKVQAGKDIIEKKLTLKQAINTRDAMAKFIYERLFEWLVEQINKSLVEGKQDSGSSISILDIYGFESFKKNSLEQFCINYANERLQQHFNRHLFKLQEEEYELDGIDWMKVEFEDNEECLNLIEKKPIGLLSLLDEESNSPSATDLTFANKLKHNLSGNPHFKGERGRAFGIRHYSGEVIYDTNGFLEKNKDPLNYESIQLLSCCSCQLLQLFASRILEQFQKQVIPSQIGACDSKKLGVGMKFKGQLFELMCHLENTTPHFICCIKPNSRQLPAMYEEDIVLEQLRCGCVLEVVRISGSGYSTRMTHQEFAKRYGLLLQKNTLFQDPLSISVAILKQFGVPPDMYQIGFTKLYLRTGQVDALERSRKQFLKCVVAVQKHFRGCQVRQRVCKLKNGVTEVQSFAVGKNAKRNCETDWTRMIDEKQGAIIYLQSVIRGMLVRKKLGAKPNLRKLNFDNAKLKIVPEKKISEAKIVPQDQVQNLQSVMEELQRLVLKAETKLVNKDEEIVFLREQLQQYEKRWSKHEEQMVPPDQVQNLRSVMEELRRLVHKGETKLVKKDEENAVLWEQLQKSEKTCSEHEESMATEDQVQNVQSVAEELEKLVLKAETKLVKKDEENAALREQLRQYENRWSEHEEKMKAMEEMWQKQMTSLKMSLATARKSVVADNPAGRLGKPDITSPPYCYDSEDAISTISHTPDASTPRKVPNAVPGAGSGPEMNGDLNAVNNLVREFEQRKQAFDDYAKSLDVKSGQPVSSKSAGADLRILRLQFEAWKKEYKARLRETKIRLQKQGSSDAENSRRRWWRAF